MDLSAWMQAPCTGEFVRRHLDIHCLQAERGGQRLAPASDAAPRLTSASDEPSAAIAAANMPSAGKPPAASSVAPTEPASSQPMLAIVILRPNSVPRNSLGISDSTAMSDG